MKSSIQWMKKLEMIEEAIKTAWLRDLDKTMEMNQLIEIQNQLLESSSFGEIFENNKQVIEYFMNRFSKEVITNILNHTSVYGINGDDIALNILVNYLKIWLKFHKENTLNILWENMRELLKNNHRYYKNQLNEYKILNKKKTYDSEIFNENLPKNNDTIRDFIIGDTVDVTIDYQESKNPIDRKAWVRGRIKNIENEKYIIEIGELNEIVCYKKGSMNVLPCGTATKDWDWRNNLKEWDVIDCYDRSSWYPATIYHVNRTEINEQIKSVYKIGFRLYPQHFPDYKKYSIFWHNGMQRDSQGNEFIGDKEGYDESITFYSKRIQKPNTKINFETARNNNMHYSSSLFYNEDLSNIYIDSFYLYESEGKKNYIIGKGNNFSYYYALLLKNFAEIDGFEKIITILEDKPSSEDVMNVFYLLSNSIPYIHSGYLYEIADKLTQSTLTFINNISNEEMRNLKKELLELIANVFNKIQDICDKKKNTADLIEEITMTISLKMIKTTIFDKRLQGIKSLNDFMKVNKENEDKLSKIIILIQDNNMINEIFGPNSHSQIINKATDIVKLLLLKDKISEADIKLIWNGTQKGDLEGKITIINLLLEVSSNLQSKHVNNLLSCIYEHIDNDLNSIEIDLVYNLSIQNQNEVNIEKCITFFTQCLLNSTTNDDSILDNIISKVINITNLFSKYTNNVLTLCTKCLETNTHAILSFKILEKYLSNEQKTNTSNELINEQRLLNIYINNWKLYKQRIKNHIKTNNINSTDEYDKIIIDSFTHIENIKARIIFLIYLTAYYQEFNSIEFLQKILIEDPISTNDQRFLFEYAKKKLDNSQNFIFLDQLNDLFRYKFNHDKNCIVNSLLEFEVFVLFFLSINLKHNNLLSFPSVSSKKKYSINALKDPEDMIGFDILWRIILEVNNEEIMNSGIEILLSLYSNDNLLPNLLQKCINLIKKEKGTIKDDLSSRNKIQKCFKIIKIIIEETESDGAGRIKSHLDLCKRSKQTLRIYVADKKISNFNLELFSNTTISDIKEICSEKIKISLKNLRFSYPNFTDMPNNWNSKTLSTLKIQNNEEFKLIITEKITKAELIINNKMNPLFESIITEWFNTYSKDGKMTSEDIVNFTAAVTKSKELMKPNDNKVTEFLKLNDKDNKGYISLHDFLYFYSEAAKTKCSIVWDNLETMKIRYNLTKANTPLLSETIDKNILPRYTLSNDKEFIDILFELFGFEDLDQESLDFLFTLTTNKLMYENLLLNDQFDYWTCKNIPKGIYELHIIQSIIEDIELSDEVVDSYCYEGFDHFKHEKINWIIRFVKNGLFKYMVLFIENSFDNKMTLVNTKLLTLSLTIINTFIQGSLYIYEEKTSKLDHIYSEALYDIESFSSQKKNKENINEYSMIYFNQNCTPKKNKEKQNQIMNQQLFIILNQTIKMNDLGSCILDSINYQFAGKLIKHIDSLLKKYNDESNDNNDSLSFLLMTFDYLMNLLVYNSDQKNLINILTQNNDELKNVLCSGIMHLNLSIRETIGKILLKYSKISEVLENYQFIIFLFADCMKIFNNDIQSGLSSGNHFIFFFNFFSNLFELVYSNNTSEFKQQLNVFDLKQEEFIIKISDIIFNDISNEDKNNLSLSQELILGLMKMLIKALENSPHIKNKIMNKKDLSEIILHKILFPSKKNIINNNDTQNELILLDELDDNTLRTFSKDVKKAFYDFLLFMFDDSESDNSIKNIELFVQIQSLKEKEYEEKSIIKSYQPMKHYYTSSSNTKSEGHVGLHNLGCICYMNSILQQMYMCPTFRYIILQSNDDKPKLLNRDDNPLHQLQRMYTYLLLSEKEDYNPKEFCYSFKDFDGNSINTSVQQDSQEFLNAFCDKIENSLKETMFKYIINSIFVGRTCSQVICEMCGNVSNRFEDFYNLTLEVANINTLHDSLKKLIEPEKIDNFNCEQCQKKVTISKRTSISDLPNVLIIHLKRFFMNYENEHTEKINSKLEFPHEINLKNFCIEELMRLKDPTYETEEIYHKEDEYYQYVLVGINVHVGSADGGHYFSFIDTKRDGNGDISELQSIDNEDKVSWLKFNDSSISKFDVKNINSECFGGTIDRGNGFIHDNCQNAYILYYERKKKTPLKILVPKPENNKDIISFKDEQRTAIKKLYDISRKKKEDDQLFSIKVLSEQKQVFYDSSKNEYFIYENYYDLPKRVSRQYYLEVKEDNLEFQQNQNKDDTYPEFYNKAINILYNTIERISPDKIPKELRGMFSNVLLGLLIKQLSKDISLNNINNLQTIIALLSKFIKEDEECLNIAVDTLNSTSTIINLLAIDDLTLLKEIIPLIQLITTKAYSITNLKEISYSICENIIQQLRSDFNLKPKMYSFTVLLETLINFNDDFIVQKLYNSNIFKTLSEYLCQRNNEDITDESTEIIIKSLYYLLKRSNEFNTNLYIDQEHKTEISLEQYYITNQLKNLMSIEVMKIIYDKNVMLYIDLLILLSEDNMKFIDEICGEITKMIQELDLSQKEEYEKLFKAIFKLLEIKDSQQLQRFCLLFGIPNFIIKESETNSPWPCFGYHLMKNKETPYLTYNNKYLHYNENCLLSKLCYYISAHSVLQIEVILMLIEKSIQFYSMFKYLFMTPWESLKYDNVFEAFVDICEINNNENKELQDRINKVKQMSLELIEKLKENDDELEHFKGFKMNYIPKDIINEKIEFVAQGCNLIMFRIEYYTTIIPYSRGTEILLNQNNYDISNTPENKDDISNDEIEYHQNNRMIDVSKRDTNDFQFFKHFLPYMGNHIFFNVRDSKLFETSGEGNLVLVRYVLYSDTEKNSFINIETIKDYHHYHSTSANDFILDSMKHYVEGMKCTNILVYHKFNHEKEISNTTNVKIKININN